MNIILSELFGTAVLILLGCGVVANVTLKKSKGYQGGFLLITLGWAMGVFTGASIAVKSGAHLNPAVTLALYLNHQITLINLFYYIVGELLGAFLGAFLCYLLYKNEFDDYEGSVLGIFATIPSKRKYHINILSETIATFVLILWILTGKSIHYINNVMIIGNNGLGYAAVSFVVLAIGASLGGSTGYAINPARDLMPRIFHSLLRRGTSDFKYSFVPIVGPLLGSIIAYFVYHYILI